MAIYFTLDAHLTKRKFNANLHLQTFVGFIYVNIQEKNLFRMKL